MSQSPVKNLYTFEEYLARDDGTDNRYELDNGELVLMNPPSIKHTLIIKFLERSFDAEIDRLSLPWLALRDTGVRTGLKSSKLPDLGVVTAEQAYILLNESAVFQTPPLLAIEVVSPESVKRDDRFKVLNMPRFSSLSTGS